MANARRADRDPAERRRAPASRRGASTSAPTRAPARANPAFVARRRGRAPRPSRRRRRRASGTTPACPSCPSSPRNGTRAARARPRARSSTRSWSHRHARLPTSSAARAGSACRRGTAVVACAARTPASAAIASASERGREPERLAHEQRVGVVGDVAGRRAEVDHAARRGRGVAVGVDVRHHVVAEALLVARGRLEVDVAHRVPQRVDLGFR